MSGESFCQQLFNLLPSYLSFQLQLEYSKYLQEVVGALENDPEFRAKLDKADEADIRVRKASVVSLRSRKGS